MRLSTREEDCNLPHQGGLSHTLEHVPADEPHGRTDVTAIGSAFQSDVFDSLNELLLAMIVCEADQVFGVGAVRDHSHTGPRGTVALRDVDVVQQGENRRTHSLEGLRGHVVRHVQADHKIGGVCRAFWVT